jgi:hypothetical protein
MRNEAVQLVRQAVGVGRRAYVLVNNRTEANAPLTVQGLVRMLRGWAVNDRRWGARATGEGLPARFRGRVVGQFKIKS